MQLCWALYIGKYFTVDDFGTWPYFRLQLIGCYCTNIFCFVLVAEIRIKLEAIRSELEDINQKTPNLRKDLPVANSCRELTCP